MSGSTLETNLLFNFLFHKNAFVILLALHFDGQKPVFVLVG